MDQIHDAEVVGKLDEPVSVGPSEQWRGGTDRLVSADHRKGEIIGLGDPRRSAHRVAIIHGKGGFAIYRKLDSPAHPQALTLRKR